MVCSQPSTGPLSSVEPRPYNFSLRSTCSASLKQGFSPTNNFLTLFLVKDFIVIVIDITKKNTIVISRKKI